MQVQLPDFSKINIFVIGDVMLDRYWTGNTQRISPEAPVPVVRVESLKEQPGGAGNVARSIMALGGQCALAGLHGDDELSKRLKSLLLSDKVKFECVQDAASETITKVRILSRHQQLIRLDFESHFSEQSISALTSHVLKTLEKYDALVLSDYGKGALKNIKSIIDNARKTGIPTFVDPKGSDFTKYKGATAVTPNYSEFISVVGECETENEVAERGRNLLSDLELKALIITRSEKGVTLIQKSGKTLSYSARAKEVFDVTGAGDTFISITAASVAAGTSFEDAVNIANVAAGIVVGKLGAATVNTEEIQEKLNSSSVSENKVFGLKELVRQVSKLRDDGQKIIMTNGCFDILHPGHVEYLTKARALGDKLIVAVNSDASVKRIKGKSRPINPLENRLAVLSGLQCVDWLVVFEEDTPIKLIQNIMPNVLVKGGDYKIDEVVGGDLVQKYGGEVVILDYVKSCSTSDIVSKIKAIGN